ncbi:MAG: 4Fe-4S binding protein [Candidatus Thorarchaeota archaeon]|nr:4Fe-4S binding protein [Candidatus Thorarchaeota archaeon]
MTKYEKTVDEINERIEDGSVSVITASEMAALLKEKSPAEAVREVDVVTTGTFGAMCSSGVWLNFGHSEPPIKMSRVWLNDVEAYTAVAAVDAYLGAGQLSETLGMAYGGGHVIEDLIRGRPIHLRAEAYGTDCYPRREISTEITIDDLNQAVMLNPRNAYERYSVATNSSDRTLYTYMGKLLPHFENATFSGAGELSPLINDPQFRTIGIGTRIFLGGAQGYIIGSGTQHNPDNGFSTLMVRGDLKQMSPEYVRGVTLTKYGVSLYVGVGVPIPILNEDIVKSTGVSDSDIITGVYDYSVPSEDRPSLKQVSYAELKSGRIELDGREVKTAPMSSFMMAQRVADLLKSQIRKGEFTLTSPVERLAATGTMRMMPQREPTVSAYPRTPHVVPEGQYVFRDESRCVHCGLCVMYCPAGVFQRDDEWRITDDPFRCVECGTCRDICPHGAISLRE